MLSILTNDDKYLQCSFKMFVWKTLEINEKFGL